MVPHVESAEMASEIVRAAYYAPRGRRGLSRTVRTHGYGLTFATDADAAPRLMMQIESVEGVKHVDSIAAVDGVDVLFVGPADLPHDLEHHAQWNVDAFDECLATVVKAAQRHQKSAGILCQDIESIKTFADQGFTEIAVESDLSILRQAYQQIQAAVRIKSRSSAAEDSFADRRANNVDLRPGRPFD